MKKQILLLLFTTTLLMEAKQGFFEKLKEKIQNKISPKKESTRNKEELKQNNELQKLYKESVKNAPVRVKDMIKTLRKPSSSKRRGMPHGILFTGKTGTGKTTLAIAMAEESGIPYELFQLEVIKEGNGCCGQFFRENIFPLLERNEKVIIILDEIQSLIGNKGDPNAFRALMALLDLVKNNRNVTVIATSNGTDDLPEPLEARFGNYGTIKIAEPNLQTRINIITFCISDVPHNCDKETIFHIAHRLKGKTTREIEYLINEAIDNSCKLSDEYELLDSVILAMCPQPTTDSDNETWNRVCDGASYLGDVLVKTAISKGIDYLLGTNSTSTNSVKSDPLTTSTTHINSDQTEALRQLINQKKEINPDLMKAFIKKQTSEVK